MPFFAALFISERTFRYLIWAIIALGAALRITVWWQDRSLFIDEANLLRNIIELPYNGLFYNLKYHQYAPPLFCIVEKWMLSVFGVHDRVARLLPLLAGLAVLVLYYRVADYYLSRPAPAMSLLFLALGELFFRYGTEAKQYATDMLTTLLLLAFVLHRPGNAPITARRWCFLGAIGIAVAWWSMPAVFVLAAIAAYLISHAFAADAVGTGLGATTSLGQALDRAGFSIGGTGGCAEPESVGLVFPVL